MLDHFVRCKTRYEFHFFNLEFFEKVEITGRAKLSGTRVCVLLMDKHGMDKVQVDDAHQVKIQPDSFVSLDEGHDHVLRHFRIAQATHLNSK